MGNDSVETAVADTAVGLAPTLEVGVTVGNVSLVAVTVADTIAEAVDGSIDMVVTPDGGRVGNIDSLRRNNSGLIHCPSATNNAKIVAMLAPHAKIRCR